VDPTITAGWIGALGGILGGAVGGGIAYLAAVNSLNTAAAQAKAAQQDEWAETRRSHQEERDQARTAALVALVWELEVNQGLLEVLEATERTGTPPVLAHRALSGASPWLGSLPNPARVAVHDAQMALAYYNAAAGRLLEFLATPRPDSWKDFRDEAQDTVMARGKALGLVRATIEQFAAARTELGRVVEL
jgi:hypothetical protein